MSTIMSTPSISFLFLLFISQLVPLFLAQAPSPSPFHTHSPPPPPKPAPPPPPTHPTSPPPPPPPPSKHAPPPPPTQATPPPPFKHAPPPPTHVTPPPPSKHAPPPTHATPPPPPPPLSSPSSTQTPPPPTHPTSHPPPPTQATPPPPFKHAPPPPTHVTPPTPPPPPSSPSPTHAPPPRPTHISPSPSPVSPSPIQAPSPSPPSPPPSSPSSACKSTLYPKLCRSILSSIRSSPSDPYKLGKFSIKQSLKQAKRLVKVFTNFLKKHKDTSLNNAEIAALEDCNELNQLNVNYLESVSEELKAADSSNNTELVEKVETYLSAVATNQYTCYDGLVLIKSNIANALAVPLNNVKQLYSVSLGLVTHAIKKNLKKHKTRKHGLPTQDHRVRQPLTKLIKLLHTKYSCTTNCTSRSERILKESESKGILLKDFSIVSLDGTANYTSIGDAIAAAPDHLRPEDGYFLIYVTEGTYEEYVIVPSGKKNILLIGDGINKTCITGNHNVVDGWTTFNSSTFAVSGERFVAVDITFRNRAGPEKHQAVAVRNNADLSTFYRCSFEGYQDTLYVHSLRQFYKECDIYGTVDFIFGNAAVVFQDCNIYARKPMPNQKNAVTAQGRNDPNQNTGISIQNCRIDAAPDLAAELNSTKNYLGRPWKVYSRTVIMQSYIGELIESDGFLEWNNTIGLDTLFYGEFGNFGPGADTSKRVQWKGYNILSVTQAWNYTVNNFTSGYIWLPDTDIPYSEGL